MSNVTMFQDDKLNSAYAIWTNIEMEGTQVFTPCAPPTSPHLAKTVIPSKDANAKKSRPCDDDEFWASTTKQALASWATENES